MHGINGQAAILGATKAGNNALNRVATDVDVAHETLSSANTLASRILALADALAGPALTEGTTGLEAPEPSGVLPRLGNSAHYTRRRLDEAFSAIHRIETSAGVL